MEAVVELVRSRTSCTHERTCGGAANALLTQKCDVTERTDARAARLWRHISG